MRITGCFERPYRYLRRSCACLTAIFAIGLAGDDVHAQITVDGLFYSTGDDARYSFLQNDTSGGSRGKAYVAVEVNTV